MSTIKVYDPRSLSVCLDSVPWVRGGGWTLKPKPKNLNKNKNPKNSVLGVTFKHYHFFCLKIPRTLFWVLHSSTTIFRVRLRAQPPHGTHVVQVTILLFYYPMSEYFMIPIDHLMFVIPGS